MNALSNTTALSAVAAPESIQDKIANGTVHSVTGAFKVDHTRGTRDGTVSSQWFTRPSDERYLDMHSLIAKARHNAEHRHECLIDTQDIRFRASPDDSDSLRLEFDIKGHSRNDSLSVAPTHYSFGQLCSLVKAPAAHYRDQLPAFLTAMNLQYLARANRESIKAYYDTSDDSLVAANGPDFGRIRDLVPLLEVAKIVGNGTGDTCWKIPGVMDWAAGTYNPFVDPTMDTTTLYLSDRDYFLFFVDDTHPIEIGKLPSGDPDLLFRGFYVRGSEPGGITQDIDCFYLRGVCQNRNLWGVESQTRVKIRHTKNASMRFAREAQPALIEFTQSATMPVIAKVNAAKDAVVARTDDERVEFLAKRGFTKTETRDVLAAVLNEEGKAAESVWDMVQGITAVARGDRHNDSRYAMERRAGALMDKVAA